MRWDAFFDDLEAQVAQQDARDLAAEVSERVRVERAKVELAERLLTHHGRPLRFGLASGEVAGLVLDVAPQWVVVQDGAGQALVPVSAVMWVQGLQRGVATPPGRVLRSLGLGHALRALSRDRAGVWVRTRAGSLHGTVDRVAKDHFDLAEHAPGQWRRAGNVRSSATVPFAALEWVRSAAQ